MAEIGLIASVIQVAGAGLKLSQTLYQYADTVASADRRIKDIAKDVELTSFVIDELGHVFRQDESSVLLSKNAVKTANETVRECSTVFTELDTALKKSQKNKLGRFMLPFRESKINLLRDHIDKLKSTLQLLMQVLTHAHQVASQKLDREAEATQREQLKALLQNKKDSAKKYEESLRNYRMHGDEDESDKEDQVESSARSLAMTASSLASTMTTKSIETCVQHIQSLLGDLESLQKALSADDEDKDPSEHQESLIESYFRARTHLDGVLLGNPKSFKDSIDTGVHHLATKLKGKSDRGFGIFKKTLSGSTLQATSSRTSEEVSIRASLDGSRQGSQLWSEAEVQKAIMEAQEVARREEREKIEQQMQSPAAKHMTVAEVKDGHKVADNALIIDQKSSSVGAISENVLDRLEDRRDRKPDTKNSSVILQKVPHEDATRPSGLPPPAPSLPLGSPFASNEDGSSLADDSEFSSKKRGRYHIKANQSPRTPVVEQPEPQRYHNNSRLPGLSQYADASQPMSRSHSHEDDDPYAHRMTKNSENSAPSHKPSKKEKRHWASPENSPRVRQEKDRVLGFIPTSTDKLELSEVETSDSSVYETQQSRRLDQEARSHTSKSRHRGDKHTDPELFVVLRHPPTATRRPSLSRASSSYGGRQPAIYHEAPSESYQRGQQSLPSPRYSSHEQGRYTVAPGYESSYHSSSEDDLYYQDRRNDPRGRLSGLRERKYAYTHGSHGFHHTRPQRHTSQPNVTIYNTTRLDNERSPNVRTDQRKPVSSPRSGPSRVNEDKASDQFLEAKYLKRNPEARKRLGAENELAFVREMLKTNHLKRSSQKAFQAREMELEAAIVQMRSQSMSRMLQRRDLEPREGQLSRDLRVPSHRHRHDSTYSVGQRSTSRSRRKSGVERHSDGREHGLTRSKEEQERLRKPRVRGDYRERARARPEITYPTVDSRSQRSDTVPSHYSHVSTDVNGRRHGHVYYPQSNRWVREVMSERDYGEQWEDEWYGGERERRARRKRQVHDPAPPFSSAGPRYPDHYETEEEDLHLLGPTQPSDSETPEERANHDRTVHLLDHGVEIRPKKNKARRLKAPAIRISSIDSPPDRSLGPSHAVPHGMSAYYRGVSPPTPPTIRMEPSGSPHIPQSSALMPTGMAQSSYYSMPPPQQYGHSNWQILRASEQLERVEEKSKEQELKESELARKKMELKYLKNNSTLDEEETRIKEAENRLKKDWESRPVQPSPSRYSRSDSQLHIDMDLAYGELPPSLPNKQYEATRNVDKDKGAVADRAMAVKDYKFPESHHTPLFQDVYPIQQSDPKDFVASRTQANPDGTEDDPWNWGIGKMKKKKKRVDVKRSPVKEEKPQKQATSYEKEADQKASETGTRQAGPGGLFVQQQQAKERTDVHIIEPVKISETNEGLAQLDKLLLAKQEHEAELHNAERQAKASAEQALKKSMEDEDLAKFRAQKEGALAELEANRRVEVAERQHRAEIEVKREKREKLKALAKARKEMPTKGAEAVGVLSNAEEVNQQSKGADDQPEKDSIIDLVDSSRAMKQMSDDTSAETPESSEDQSSGHARDGSEEDSMQKHSATFQCPKCLKRFTRTHMRAHFREHAHREEKRKELQNLPKVRKTEAQLVASDRMLAEALGKPSIAPRRSSPQQTIDFAATVAAGLQESGFNSNVVSNSPTFLQELGFDSIDVLNDPAFHHRSTLLEGAHEGHEDSLIGGDRGTHDHLLFGGVVGAVGKAPDEEEEVYNENEEGDDGHVPNVKKDNQGKQVEQETDKLKIWEAARATSAAPFFAPHGELSAGTAAQFLMAASDSEGSDDAEESVKQRGVSLTPAPPTKPWLPAGVEIVRGHVESSEEYNEDESADEASDDEVAGPPRISLSGTTSSARETEIKVESVMTGGYERFEWQRKSAPEEEENKNRSTAGETGLVEYGGNPIYTDPRPLTPRRAQDIEEALERRRRHRRRGSSSSSDGKRQHRHYSNFEDSEVPSRGFGMPLAPGVEDAFDAFDDGNEAEESDDGQPSRQGVRLGQEVQHVRTAGSANIYHAMPEAMESSMASFGELPLLSHPQQLELHLRRDRPDKRRVLGAVPAKTYARRPGSTAAAERESLFAGLKKNTQFGPAATGATDSGTSIPPAESAVATPAQPTQPKKEEEEQEEEEESDPLQGRGGYNQDRNGFNGRGGYNAHDGLNGRGGYNDGQTDSPAPTPLSAEIRPGAEDDADKEVDDLLREWTTVLD